MTAFAQGNRRASKLSMSDVQEIRRLYSEGRVTQGSLSRQFHVSVIQIGRIVRGEVWQQLPVLGNMISEGELKDSEERMGRWLVETGKMDRLPPSPLDGGDAPDETQGGGFRG